MVLTSNLPLIIANNWEKLNRGGFPIFSGKVQIVSRTLSGLFLVGTVARPRKRKRTNQENPRRVPGQIGKIPEKIGKVPKRTKRDKKGRTSPDRENPPFETPPSSGLEISVSDRGFAKGWLLKGWFWQMFLGTKNGTTVQ